MGGARKVVVAAALLVVPAALAAYALGRWGEPANVARDAPTALRVSAHENAHAYQWALHIGRRDYSK